MAVAGQLSAALGGPEEGRPRRRFSMDGAPASPAGDYARYLVEALTRPRPAS